MFGLRRALLASLIGLVHCTGPEYSLVDYRGASAIATPEGFPPPDFRRQAEATPEKIELGRHIFYDKRLSRDGDFSCASCHHQAYAFADSPTVADGSIDPGLPFHRRAALPMGTTGATLVRSSMPLFNLIWMPVYTWVNPLLKTLQAQALVPIFGENPVELGLADRESQWLDMIRTDPNYQQLFRAAFPTVEDPFTIAATIDALTAFQFSLISANSRFDKWQRREGNLTPEETRGLELFFSEAGECFHCHGGFNFTDTFKDSERSEVLFNNNGLYNLDGNGAYPTDNPGLKEFTFNPGDMGKFRSPSLRNVEITFPYMHDGTVSTLEDVVDHYAMGGLAKDAPFGTPQLYGPSPLTNSFVRPFPITAQEKSDLIAFLKSLTDCEFVHNPAHANPWPAGSTNNPHPDLEKPQPGHPCHIP